MLKGATALKNADNTATLVQPSSSIKACFRNDSLCGATALKNADKRPIALFDSGVGGLFFLKRLREFLPNEDFIYFADQRFCPYGKREDDFIRARVKAISAFLGKKRVKLLCIVCNTASSHKSVAYNDCAYVEDVLSAACAEASLKTVNKKIAVLATTATVNKGKYFNFFDKLGMEVLQIPADQLVLWAEDPLIYREQGLNYIDHLAKKINDFSADTLVLGCTHFAFFKEIFAKKLKNINIATGEEQLVKNVENRLIEGLFVKNCNKNGSLTVYTTGRAEEFKEKLLRFELYGFKLKEVDV